MKARYGAAVMLDCWKIVKVMTAFSFIRLQSMRASFIQDFEDIDLENLGGDTTTTTERVEYLEMPVENEVQSEMLEEESDEEYDSDYEIDEVHV